MNLTRDIAAAMSEAELERAVRRLIEDLGLLGYHTRDSRRSPEGYPDWTIAGKRVIFRELKTEKGRTTAAQSGWLQALIAARADAGIWRPSDLMAGRIARELAAISVLPVAPDRTGAA